ncbi:MAG TPA: 1-deoxy-D-xylulose-5-phosphate synthase [Bacillota bacterium]|nr:1-deoxy-D-xylulose-5-phosphate synthase [Bacillota bacterium]
MKHLQEYNFPEDLKTMSEKELVLLSYDIRDFLIEKISDTGGHLASNLGVVELTIALHRIFDSPKDKIIWDVGHQAYVHKILTGRSDKFDTLRSLDGISGFPKRSESPHDMYDSGHASTSLSIAAGYVAARELCGTEGEVIAVIGDGAMTGGVAFEAINDIGSAASKIIVVLNDNEMSIEKSSGGLSQHLGKLRASKAYLEFKRQLKKTLKGVPRVGDSLYSGFEHIRDTLKYALVPGAIFESIGFKYFGPIDGHNIHEISDALLLAKNLDGPVLLHVVTKKGKGYRNAEFNPCRFHGISPFDPITGNLLASSDLTTYSCVAGKKLAELGRKNEKIVGITAAMMEATGLSFFHDVFPERTYDVGIAEQHATAFAAGLALAGFRPAVMVYSTFLQRAYDQIIEDVCIPGLPVLFLIDRAGNVGNDGETHHGVFDLSYLSHMPGMTVMAPKDGKELSAMMDYAMSLNGPCAIRYPRGTVSDLSFAGGNYEIDGGCEVLAGGKDVSIVALGKMVESALEVGKELKKAGIEAEIINSRFLKPMDLKRIIESVNKTSRLVTMEDNVVTGGLASTLLLLLSENKIRGFKHLAVGWPDKFIEHGDVKQLFYRYGMDTASVTERVRDFFEGKA